MGKLGRGMCAAIAAIAVVAAWSAVLAPSIAGARGPGGRLDPAFGQRGKESLRLGRRERDRYASPEIAATPDGGLAVLRGSTLELLDKRGAPVRSFGSGGKVSLEATVGSRFRPTDMAVDSIGRILVSGVFESDLESGRPEDAPPGITESLGEVARFTARGSLDSSFAGGGTETYDFGFEPPLASWSRGSGEPSFKATVPEVEISRIAIGPAGQLFLSGSYVTSRGYGKYMLSPYEYSSRTGYLARLNGDGELDQNFGDGGVSTVEPRHFVADPVPDPDGGVVFGEAEYGSHLVCLGADGGQLPVEAGPSSGLLRLALDPRARRIIELRVGENDNGYNTHSKMQVVAVSLDGSVVTGFGEGGSIDVERPEGGIAEDVFVDGRGRILIDGEAGDKLTEPRSFFVERLLPDGRPDRHFGFGGLVQTRIHSRPLWGGMSAALMPGGGLVLADLLRSPREEESERFWANRVQLARYLP